MYGGKRADRSMVHRTFPARENDGKNLEKEKKNASGEPIFRRPNAANFVVLREKLTETKFYHFIAIRMSKITLGCRFRVGKTACSYSAILLFFSFLKQRVRVGRHFCSVAP